jgi:hypothetical protein
MGEGEGSGEKKADEPSAEQRDAGAKPVPEGTEMSDDSFDDLIIEVDLAELEAELGNQPPGRKY